MEFTLGSYLLRTSQLPFRVQPNSPNKALLIVETRPSFFLPYVVESAVRAHPGWKLYVIGTEAVHRLLESSCVNYSHCERGMLPLKSRLTVPMYSYMMLSHKLWDLVDEEHILVFQSDCVVVRTTPTSFLQYDYVGAACKSREGEDFVMNGGLSLRRKSAMKRAIDLMHAEHPDMLTLPEDEAFTAVMRAHPDQFTLPTREACNQFAIESWGDPSKAIGIHGTDKYYCSVSVILKLLGEDTGEDTHPTEATEDAEANEATEANEDAKATEDVEDAEHTDAEHKTSTQYIEHNGDLICLE